MQPVLMSVAAVAVRGLCPWLLLVRARAQAQPRRGSFLCYKSTVGEARSTARATHKHTNSTGTIDSGRHMAYADPC